MNTTTQVDLTNCDREAIHIPGSIQPHGCLIACDETATTVLRHSVNAREILKCDGDIQGRPLVALIGAEGAHAVRNALTRTRDPGRASLMFAMKLPDGGTYDVAAHRFNGAAILEFEPADMQQSQPLDLARSMIGRITTIDSVEKLLRDTTRLLHAMLGYDRVMVYAFGADGAGKVMSETKRADLESFLGQYFPASDIPQQARALYLRNTIRIISDVDFKPVPVLPVLDSGGHALDLSFAHLRSVSPIHCEYLRNMGVGASMSISIIVDGTLWGLIACHHYSPRVLTMAERVAAEMFGEFFSLHLSALKQRNKLEAATRARQALDRFVRLAARTPEIEMALLNNMSEFATLIPSDGVGIWVDEKWDSIGSTPPASAIPALAHFAESAADGRIWASHKLSEHVTDAADYAAAAAGVLIVPLSQRPRDYLFFFRKEMVHTLDWAGNPDKSYETGPLGDRLTPRKSFAIWKETVALQANPWVDEDLESAEAVRAALVEVVLHHNERLQDERARGDIRQRMLNDELNHRVKNILAVIRSLVSQSGPEGQKLESYVASLRGRIQALAHAHDQVVRGDGGGSLRDLVEAELMPYRASGSSMSVEGPPLWLDARAYSVMALVLHELATNAAKYGALSSGSGRLAVVWDIDADGSCTVDWRETGGPLVNAPSRRGFGSLLVERSIPFDLGGESRVDFGIGGVTGQFRLPAKHVDAGKAATTAPAATHAPLPPPPEPMTLKGRKALLVEDQMLIAMDLEQILRDEGIEDVQTVGTSEDAMARLLDFEPDFAVLDVNLGSGTSVAVADALARRGIRFVFATGYGDRSNIPPAHSDVPVVTKPYDPETIVAAIDALFRV
jgi:light-regulated signal transduction histidine kinase (bacteriophytochrome)